MNNNDLIKNYNEYNNIFNIHLAYIVNILNVAAKKENIICQITSRVKSLESISKKIKKHSDLNSYEITDLCGVRIIVGTKTDKNNICELIAKFFIIDKNNSNEIENYKKKYSYGYKATHFVICNQRNKSSESYMNIKTEIQVRTIWENVWDEAWYDKIYKSDDRLDSATIKEIRELSHILEELDNKFDSILARMK